MGLVFIVVGVLLLLLSRIPGVSKLGHLPGDIVYRRGNFVFYFPLMTCLIISVILTLIFTLLFRR
ncbi:MAG TPA: DUF2905 domain-containing protein [Candidatus Atribacteria bacterium]|nr:DUF2905 domain-containing protein [Candidatus Atribacteria bacterium]